MQRGLASAHSLDAVIVAHDAYLKYIMDRALLAPQHESLHAMVGGRMREGTFV